MLPVSEVEAIILNLVKPFNPEIDSENLPLSQALNRILAEDIKSELDFPHWDNSAMDGYALNYDDITDVQDLQNFKLAIASEDIPAGKAIAQSLKQGECVRIFTGGMLPKGADTVIMQEDTERIENLLKLKIKPTQGEYVRRQGEFIKAGTTLLKAGTKIGATEIGALASARCQEIKVYRQPKVALISTGQELVSLENSEALQSGQIIDSNVYALSALVQQVGAIAIPYGTVQDDQEILEKIMEQAIHNADIVISSGGVSVGDYDYIDEILEKMGADIHVRSVAIKPGKPLTVASFTSIHIVNRSEDRILYFGVPGNPVSAMMSFWRFIRGAIAKLNGANEIYWHPQFIQAITTEDLHAQGRRETYLWGKLNYIKGIPTFQPTHNYSSGNLISAIGTNAIAILRVNQTYVPAGDEALIMLI
ncbi:molybdopterin molybdotransferase MoeA [Pseudanabaena sp. FACHB-1998]|uniref:molybdopterin molybdotransferase MoeA n=1 Tax=Pseudanabaena sp. FACHB-1998 TaxID=2692858 RepID=UPI001680BB32|nr:gephyrin-like molybdotransferase Glp [Pseudanabaena sp. FACHB-1998]MBD2177992.1 molybdopterin molybdotransferase MoeA [Pseudanabaena sp. FACHB-1998]